MRVVFSLYLSFHAQGRHQELQNTRWQEKTKVCMVTRCRLLVADGNGSLRLLELEAGSSRKTTEFSLTGKPECMAVHQPSATMVVVVHVRRAVSDSQDNKLHAVTSCLKLVDPASGVLFP